MRKTSLGTLILFLCCIALLALPASAQLINLNFSTIAYTTPAANETSPATPTGPAGTWNNLTTATFNDPNSFESLSAATLLSDGSTGPTLTFDSTSGSNNDPTMMSWSATSYVFPTTVDYTTAGGVYDVPNLYESGVGNAGNNLYGFRVKGLAAGNYDVFVVPIFRGTQAAGVKANTDAAFVIGVGNDTDGRNMGTGTGLTSTAISATQNIDTTLTSWVAATDGSTPYNYIGGTVAIDGPNRWLTILLQDAASSNPDRPGASVIQIRQSSGPVELLGDYNQNNRVDAADYVVWRDKEGQTLDLPNDGLGSVMIDSFQYGVWASHFGNGTGGSSAAILSASTVPEPNTLLMAILAAATLCGRGRSRIH